MTIKPDLESKLVAFLDGEWRKPLEDLGRRFTEHEQKNAEQYNELIKDRGAVSARLGNLEERTDKLEERTEHTGRNAITQLEGQLAARTSGRQYATSTIIAIVFGLAGFGTAIASLLRGH